MECKGIRERLPAYLEKVVTPQEETLIARHLSSCRKCARALLDLKRTGEIIKDLDTVESPPWMTQKIMSRIRAEEGKKKGIFQKLFYPLHVKVPIEAFATVLIAVVAIYVFKAVEPQMKANQAPSAPEQTLSKDETPKQPSGPGAAPPALGEKPVAKESLKQADRTDRARREDERDKGSLADKKEAAVASGAKEDLPVPGASKPVPAEPPSPSVPAKKKEVVGNSYGEPTRATEPSGPQALPQQQYAPAAAAKQKEGLLEKDAVGGKIRRGKALSAAPPVEAVAEKKAAHIGITVRVEDVSTAIEEVERLLGRLGALKIEKESIPNLELITAELRTEKMQELIVNLMLIGEVGVSSPSLNSAEEGTRIRIEIVSNP